VNGLGRRERGWKGDFWWKRRKKGPRKEERKKSVKKRTWSFLIKVKVSKSIIVEKKHLYRI
jgi:hypothetical protein